MSTIGFLAPMWQLLSWYPSERFGDEPFSIYCDHGKVIGRWIALIFHGPSGTLRPPIARRAGGRTFCSQYRPGMHPFYSIGIVLLITTECESCSKCDSQKLPRESIHYATSMVSVIDKPGTNSVSGRLQVSPLLALLGLLDMFSGFNREWASATVI